MVTWQELVVGQIWSITPNRYVVDVNTRPDEFIARVYVLAIEEIAGELDEKTVIVGWPWNREGEKLVLQVWKSFPFEHEFVDLIGSVAVSVIANALARSPSKFSRGWAKDFR